MKYQLTATSGSIEIYYRRLLEIKDSYWVLTKEIDKSNSQHYNYTIEFNSENGFSKLCKEINIFICENQSLLERFGIYRNCGIIVNYLGENDKDEDEFEIEIYDYWQD